MATHTASLNRIGKYPTILIEETPGKFPTPFTRKNTRKIPYLFAKKILGNPRFLHMKNIGEIPANLLPDYHNNIVNS